MNNEITTKVFEYIDALALNLGVASEHVYTLLVKQQMIGGISGIIFAFLYVIVGYLAVKKISEATLSTEVKAKSGGWFSDTTIGEDLTIFARRALWVVYGIVVIIALFTLPYDLMRLINPEYYAIKEILNVFGK